MSAKQYDEVIVKLAAAGASAPPGRLHHSCFGPPDHLMAYDVWESEEQFAKFGETLMPILAEVGITPGTPDIMPVHNIIE